MTWTAITAAIDREDIEKVYRSDKRKRIEGIFDMESYRKKLSIFLSKTVNTGELSESFVDYKPQGQLQCLVHSTLFSQRVL